jgi:hypothetical protein
MGCAYGMSASWSPPAGRGPRNIGSTLAGDAAPPRISSRAGKRCSIGRGVGRAPPSEHARGMAAPNRADPKAVRITRTLTVREFPPISCSVGMAAAYRWDLWPIARIAVRPDSLSRRRAQRANGLTREFRVSTTTLCARTSRPSSEYGESHNENGLFICNCIHRG